MSESKIWHRQCISCKEVELVQYTENDRKSSVVHTTCPDKSLQDTNANYKCRSCRSKMTLESLELQLKMMENQEHNARGSIVIITQR
ncbi:hypothetical protein HG530_008906 [Fusarium avenaceum]|nr:hypothetical protein HG530_008906 [Fusarium avenaceum]